MLTSPTSAMSHPLWDSPDSPLQAGRVSTMQSPSGSQPRASVRMAGNPDGGAYALDRGYLPAQGGSQGQAIEQMAVPRRTMSRNQAPSTMSDPTLSGLRARYSRDQAELPRRSDGMPGGNEIARSSISAAQWTGGAMEAQPERYSMAGPARAYDGASRPSMGPQRILEMPRRTSIAMPDHQQPRMSTYAAAQPQSPSRRGTRELANGYPVSGAALMSGSAGPNQDPGMFQSSMQQGAGVGDRRESMRMRSSGVRESMLAGQLQEEAAGYGTPLQPSRPSMVVQQGSPMSPRMDRTSSRHG